MLWSFVAPLVVLALIGAVMGVCLFFAYPLGMATGVAVAVAIGVVLLVAMVPFFVNITARLVQGDASFSTVTKDAYRNSEFIYGVFGLLIVVCVAIQIPIGLLMLWNDKVFVACATLGGEAAQFFVAPALVFAALGVSPVRAVTTSARLMKKATMSHIGVLFWASAVCDIVGVWFLWGTTVSSVLLLVFSVFFAPALRTLWDVEFPEYPLNVDGVFSRYDIVPNDGVSVGV